MDDGNPDTQADPLEALGPEGEKALKAARGKDALFLIAAVILTICALATGYMVAYG